MKACRLPVALLAVLLALVALPAGGSAAPAPTAACAAILAPRPAIELPVQVAPGLTVRVRDPYGGLIARNRLFVAFSVRYRNPADRARVASVTWTLDGAAPRRDEGGRDQLLAPSTMYAAGRHVVRVRLQPAGGGRAVEAELQVTATDCQLAHLSQRADLRGGGLEAAVASGGPALRAIELRPGSGRFGTPQRAPGHGRAVRRTHPSAARLGSEPRRAQPAHHGAAARYDRGPRAPRARRARTRAPLRAVGVASPRQRRAAGARDPALLSRLAAQRREAPCGRPAPQPPRSKK